MKNKDTLTVVITGKTTEVTFNPHQPLHTIIPEALHQTNNSGPPDRWEIKDKDGNVLNPDQKIEDFHFPPEVKLFLSLRIGVGG